MRTATTIHRTAAGWVLAAGPDVPADKQRANFNNIGDHWPKDVLEVRFQFGDQPFRTRDREQATTIAAQIRNAEKKAAEKLENAAKIEAALKAAAEKAKADKAEQEARENAKAIAAKEASKAANPVKPQVTQRSAVK